jgi:hypothetical protein
MQKFELQCNSYRIFCVTIHVHIHTHSHSHTHTHTHTLTHTHTHTNTHTHTHTNTHTLTHTLIHTHSHTHTHTHIYLLKYREANLPEDAGDEVWVPFRVGKLNWWQEQILVVYILFGDVMYMYLLSCQAKQWQLIIFTRVRACVRPCVRASRPCFSETAEDIWMKLDRWVEGNVCQTVLFYFVLISWRSRSQQPYLFRNFENSYKKNESIPVDDT